MACCTSEANIGVQHRLQQASEAPVDVDEPLEETSLELG
jgi:hypothetical protein